MAIMERPCARLSRLCPSRGGTALTATQAARDVDHLLTSGYERSFPDLMREALRPFSMQERCTHDSVVPDRHSRSK